MTGSPGLFSVPAASGWRRGCPGVVFSANSITRDTEPRASASRGRCHAGLDSGPGNTPPPLATPEPAQERAIPPPADGTTYTVDLALPRGRIAPCELTAFLSQLNHIDVRIAAPGGTTDGSTAPPGAAPHA